MAENLDLQIPKTWIKSTVGDVCSQPQYGYTTKAATSGTLKLLRTTDITSGLIDWSSVPYCSENPEDINKYLLEDGDIVISRAGSVGVSYLLKNPERSVFASYLIRFKPLIDKKFFKLFLESSYYWQAISDNKLGIAVQNVNASKLKDISLPIPPLNEQHRIVTKIEELFSELDKGVESLKVAREQLKVYRQVLLKHAFEGKLTEQWRKAQGDKLETADQLLERIKQERERRYQQQIDEWEIAGKVWEANGKKGVKPSKPRESKALPPLTKQELAKLPQLPDGWTWVTIDWMLSQSKKAMTTGPFGTMLKKSEHKKSGVPVLGIENIGNGKFQHGSKIYVTLEKSLELESFEVEANDIVISRSGTVGEICKVPEGLGKALISTNLMRVSLNKNTVNSDYFIYLFQGGGSVKDQVRELCKGSTRNFLNQTILSSIIFPLPSLIEQEQIVCEVENCLFIIEQLEKDIKQNLQKAEALRQSILKKAFSGQLVPQDLNDEPASILLEGIRAEREQQKLKSTKSPPRRSVEKRSVEPKSESVQQLKSLHQPDVPIVPSRQLSKEEIDAQKSANRWDESELENQSDNQLSLPLT